MSGVSGEPLVERLAAAAESVGTYFLGAMAEHSIIGARGDDWETVASREAAETFLLPVVEQELAAAEARGAARALREATDAWQRGQWTAITAKVKERNVLGTAQIVGDWIRARAALGGERETGR